MALYTSRLFIFILFIFNTFLNINAQNRDLNSRKEILEKKLNNKKVTEVDKEKDFISSAINLPEIKREFRGAWIASVANINWPSKKNLSTEEQKKEAIKLLDLLADANFNAVIFQIRPSADALYNSALEPWSVFLTGEVGKSPFPYYDPLTFWIEESHKRGMELHVWINPYRAHHSNGGKISEKSLVKKMPDNIVRLKNGMYWFDPSHIDTQNHVSKVIKDIVLRYDIDAVHFDDYFYPYASYNGGQDFPDFKTWLDYTSKGGKLSKPDWRRNSVNLIIKRIHKEIKEVKPYVKFGISPFGIWKPGYPKGISGLSQFDELYADAKLWLNEGWIDYLAPQLYWPTTSKKQNFSALLEWWQSENVKKIHLWPGLNTVEVKAENRTKEIIKQIEISQELLPNSSGVIHWSIAGLINNPNLVHNLKNTIYKEKAIIPKTPWIKGFSLEKPILKFTTNNNSVMADWSLSEDKNVFQWVVFCEYENDWETNIYTQNILSKNIAIHKEGKKLKTIVVKAIDRLGNESEYTSISLRK